MKPHIYKVSGRWFCRVDYPKRRVVSVGKNTPMEAYADLRSRTRLIRMGWENSL